MIKKQPIDWQFRDTIILFIIPLEFLLSYLFGLTAFRSNELAMILFSLGSKGLSFGITIFLYSSFLNKQWQLFKHKIWLKLLYGICGALALTLLLSLVRMGSRLVLTNDLFEEQLSPTSLLLMVLAAIPPLLAPIVEEIIFRQVLLFKFISYKFICLTLLLFTALVFGTMHYYNFGGNLILTLPYMIASLYFGVIYLLSKNIWYSITIHFIFNFGNSMLPTLFLIIFSFFS